MNDRKSEGRRSPMQNDVSTARKGPQLTPEIQSKIGQQLRKIYDDMVSQGVPDRFVDLLDRLEGQGETTRVDKSAEKQNDPNRLDKSSNKESR